MSRGGVAPSYDDAPEPRPTDDDTSPTNARPRGTADRRAPPGALEPDGVRDACGIGFVADAEGRPDHGILRQGLQALENLAHRGAVAADGATGDGAGVLLQLRRPWAEACFDDADAPHRQDETLALGMAFLPRDEGERAAARTALEDGLEAQDLDVRGWRTVPTDPDALGRRARRRRPAIEQALVAAPGGLDGDEVERRLYLARRRAESRAREEDLPRLHMPSLSHRTVVYKGLLGADQVAAFYPDLSDPRLETAICVFHQRFATNTWPTWHRAQPFRFLGHNGEINTLRGNVHWWSTREAHLEEAGWGEDADVLRPVIDEDGSDSAMLDNVLELLVRSGRSLGEALLTLQPEAHEGRDDLPDDLEAFYDLHASVMEPWDGPAALVVNDGRTAAARLDRNGLRPMRYWITSDGRVVCASEAGPAPLEDAEVVERGRLGPGEMIAVDTEAGRVLHDDEAKARAVEGRPDAGWLETRRDVGPDPAPVRPGGDGLEADELLRVQRLHDYGRESLSRVFEPMCYEATEPVGSMGDDTPLAFLSRNPQPLHRYAKQRFAQVTNPPIDSLRERAVMSLETRIGPRDAPVEPTPGTAARVDLPSPVADARQLAYLRDGRDPDLQVRTIQALFPVADGPGGLEPAVEGLRAAAVRAVEDGADVLVLSDREADGDRAPVPALLAVSTVHHALIDAGLRTSTNLVAEAGSVREDHHLACLVGFGADLVHPYVAFETAANLALKDPREEGLGVEESIANYRRALEKGLLKIMSKMGIGSVDGYRGAQIFEFVGLDQDLVDAHFPGTPARVGCADLETLAADVLRFHADAFGQDPELEARGFYRFRRGGEYHAYNPDVFRKVHEAVQNESWEAFEEYIDAVEDRPPTCLRDLLDYRRADEPVPLEEVEPAEEIARRFCTGAMSHGSISAENHEMLAVAMNRLGGKSNTGEGGEDPERFTGFDEDRPDRSLADWHPKADDDPNSAIKQVASGRFGVTPSYLAASDEVEIKMAQGSKPGEGGQIPGHKVSEEIAGIRGAVPGVPLISPPPHHDIYSIEDLAQLIHDLKRGTVDSRVAVKLVAESGVGTIAAGVAKGYADTIQISGHDGGTGASPLSSIKHAGVAWELGLSETQTRLVENRLRGRVRLRADGGMKTGRDVVMAALFGAEEFGFGTASLVASGCVMTRQCHENTCPVGVATQDPELRARFGGKPDHVVAFFLYLARQVRMILSRMGVRSLDEVVGRVDLLEPREDVDLPKGGTVDLSSLLDPPDAPGEAARRCRQPRNENPLPEVLDEQVVADARPALEEGETVEETYDISNPHRTVGARLGGTVARVTEGEGLPPGSIDLTFRGAAGQSFGAFCTDGMRLTLEGEGQDYVGKGMGGGTIAVVPPEAGEPDRTPVVMGNTVLYGATGGSLYAAGAAGERLCVRNSGARAVVEGCGDHGCEYMTRGVAVVLGETGRNFGAGMHGGAAYVWDPSGTFEHRIHADYVALEPVEADVDAQLLRSLVERHAEETGSTRAAELLERWGEALSEFRKVVPLEQRECEAEAAGDERVARRALEAVESGQRDT